MWKNQREEKTLNTKLFVRILPSTDFHYDSIKTESTKKVLYVRCLQDLSKGVNVKNPNYWYFCTDGIFWNSCQSEVYETVTSGLYKQVFDGVGAMILSYGQVGTGKTYTTSGLRFSFQNRGLILRILSQLFDEEEARRDVSRITFGMSYLEFSGQKIKDLISNKQIDNFREIAEYPIPDENWAWKQIFKAESRKSYTEPGPYEGSNRGHSVLTLYIHSESLIESDTVNKHSKIHIVDMGGIDNYGNKPSAWKDKTDVGNSNLSKSLMEQFILCLTGAACRNENYVCPYKASRFLLYLHDTLKNSCILRFVAHIHGNFENLSLTLSTLRFGERIRAMKPKNLERVYQSNRDLQTLNLEKDYIRLKCETELMGMLNDSPDYSNISQERLQEIRRAAEAFLFNQLEDLTIFNLGQISLTLKVFRDLYQKLSEEKEQIVKDAVAAATEMMQSQMAGERNLVTGNITASSQKVSRRRSRQVESQTSFGATHRSTDSASNLGKSTSTVHQSGVIDRKGIAIGPGKTASTFEGNVTKAFKKLRSKKSESVIMKGLKSAPTKELGTLSSKNQISDGVSEFSFGQGIPSRESAWQHFFNEKIELAHELGERVENAEERAKEAKRKYTKALSELARLREELEENRLELEMCQHIRVVQGKEELEEEEIEGEEEMEEGLQPADHERKLMEILAQKEGLLNGAVESCHVALTDFRNAAEDLNEAKKVLDDVFQEFCKEHYKTAFIPTDLTDDLKPDESGKPMQSEWDFRTENKMQLYATLQEKFLHRVPKNPKNSRKEWIYLF